MAFLTAITSVSNTNNSIHRRQSTSLRRSTFLTVPPRRCSLSTVAKPNLSNSSPFIRFQIVSSLSPADMSKPKILISGPPASGKGTQCEYIVDKYNVVHISTGDMLRAAVKSGSELGLKAKAFMDAGDLVPDDLVISMLKQRISQDDCKQNGWLLDGFPRTAVQAQALDDAGIIPSAVILLQVEDDVLVERVVGRRLDPVTGQIYHMKFSPPQDKETSERLIQRSDDTEDKARVRLNNYYTHAQNIQDHYQAKIQIIEGNRSKTQVFKDLESIIDQSIQSNDDTDDNNNNPSGGASTTNPTNYGTTQSEQSTRGIPVSEFVRRAEEAYERGSLDQEDVNWSGQAAADSPDDAGTSNYLDLLKRMDLVFGDFVSLLLFAYIGRASHGDRSFDLDVFKTAAPFLAAWFVTTPLLGAYTRQATANVAEAVKSFTKSWAIAVPMGIALRGVITEHVPPLAFAVITMISTFVITGSWRVLYVKVRGDEDDDMRRGGILDGFRMVTALLRRW